MQRLYSLLCKKVCHMKKNYSRTEARARIRKRLRSPRIDSASLCITWRDDKTKRVIVPTPPPPKVCICKRLWGLGIDSLESIPGILKPLQIRAEVWRAHLYWIRPDSDLIHITGIKCTWPGKINFIHSFLSKYSWFRIYFVNTILMPEFWRMRRAGEE